MKFPRQPYPHPVIQTLLVLAVAVLLLPHYARAECKEFKIVEYEDRVEAVCVGEPLTEEQKKAKLEEEKRQEAEAQRQRAEESRIQMQDAAKNKAKTEAEAAAERKKQVVKPVTPPQPVDRNIVTNPQILYK